MKLFFLCDRYINIDYAISKLSLMLNSEYFWMTFELDTHVSHEIVIFKKYLGKKKVIGNELVVIYFSPANKLSKLPSCKHLAMTN